MKKNNGMQRRGQGAIRHNSLATHDEALTIEIELKRDEIARGLRNIDGSIPPSASVPSKQSQERRPELNPKIAHSGEQLAKWLNDSVETPGHRHVYEILDELKAISNIRSEPYWRTAGRIEDQSFSGALPNEFAASDAESEKRLLRLSRKVRPYVFRLAFCFPLGRQWVGSFVPVGKLGRRHQFRLNEYDAVLWLHEIALNGELERLRQCECKCGEWFFAHRFDKRHVRDHRQREYKNSQEFKDHRAAYMRKYRRNDKERVPDGRQQYRHRVRFGK